VGFNGTEGNWTAVCVTPLLKAKIGVSVCYTVTDEVAETEDDLIPCAVGTVENKL